MKPTKLARISLYGNFHGQSPGRTVKARREPALQDEWFRFGMRELPGGLHPESIVWTPTHWCRRWMHMRGSSSGCPRLDLFIPSFRSLLCATHRVR